MRVLGPGNKHLLMYAAIDLIEQKKGSSDERRPREPTFAFNALAATFSALLFIF